MRESYVIKLDGSVRTELELFAAFTDTMYLGESSIPGWDQFFDLLFSRLNDSDIQLRVEVMDDFALWPTVAPRLEWIADALLEDCPDKLLLVRPHH